MKRMISFFLVLVMLVAMLPQISFGVFATVNEHTYCNGTDYFETNDGCEYFINSDDEDRLYKITGGTEELVLDEHVILLVNANEVAYLVVYSDEACKLVAFNVNSHVTSDVYTFPAIVSNIALKDNELLYTLGGAAYSLNLSTMSSTVVQESDVATLYFDSDNSLQFLSASGVEMVQNESTNEAQDTRGTTRGATSYTPRLTAPATDNPYYTTLNVFHQCGYGMAPNIGNCTCYAFGRSYENLGTEPKLSHGNAGGWYDYNRNNGYYSFGKTPVLGAVAVWKSGGAGHVAVVEVIDGDTVTTSESGWKSFYFKTVTRSASNSNFSASSYYSFQGFIYVMGTSTSSQPSNLGIQSDREIYPDHEVIHLTWEVDAPNGYNLHLVDVNTEQRLDILYPYSNKYYDIMGLPAGNYRVALYTFDENNNYSFHSVTEFSVCTEKPLENNTLCADKKTYKKSDTVYLSWSASTLLYDLHVSYNNGSDVIYETGKTSYELSNLAVGQYRIALYTLNDFGWTCGNAITFSVIEDHVCNKSEYVFYESVHPHYKCYRCSICGEIWRNFDEATMIDSCLECHRPATPVLLGMREIYDPNENIVFNWNTTINTTHYNAYFDKRNSNGEFVRIENAFYVESGFSRKLEKGYYRIILQSTNSDYFETDGSNWLFSEGDWVEFEVSHSYKDIVTDPTCTGQGYTTHTCSACGDSYKDTYTAALGHNYSYKVTTTPTTSATGVLTGTCGRCSGTTTVTLPKLNTTDYSYSVVKAATCTATGTGRYTWKTTTYGSYYFDVTLAKTAHNYTTKVTAPTCTAQGYTTHTCTACGDSYKDTYTAALGHNYSYKVTTTPTTSATGALTGTCSRCSGTTTVMLPKLNTTDYSYSVVKAAICTATGTGRYTWKTTTYGSYYFDVTLAKTAHNYTTKVTAPTCTAQGYTTHSCTACGDSYKDTYTAALGHNYSYKVTTTPTTSATGVLTGTCSRCSGTTTVILPKLNTTDYNYSIVKAATCTATGTGRYTWKTTTYGSFYFDVTIAKTAHNYTATVTAPTCTAQGYTTHTCTACGDSYKDTYTAALGHNYSYKVTTTPTTSATGALTGTCSRCSGTTTVTLPKLNTTDYSYSVVKAATCTAMGTGRYTWKTTTYGSYNFDVTIAKTAHSYTTKVTAPTCTAQGYTTHTCTACGDSYKDTYTAALGHNYSYKVTTVPTTSATGALTGTCSRCSGTTTVTLPKLNTTDYNYSVVNAATCTATGTGRYTWKTTTYGSYYFDVTIAKTAHNYSATVTAPTCTAQGYTTHTCTACGDSYKDTFIAALGHSESTWIVDHNATCTASGSKHTECTRCGVVMQTATIAANGHTAGMWIIDNNATCTASGTKHTECTVCSATLETATIPAAGHSYTTSVTEPTCTAQGYTTHTCTVCGDSYKDTYTTELGHAWDNGAVTTQPTETTEGVKTFTCTRCGETKTESVPALGHEHHYTDTVTEPTCTEKGYTTHTCECGDNYNDTYVDALGHAWDNGTVTTQPTETTEGVKTFTCTRCGITRTETIPTTGNKPCDGGADCPSGKFVDVNPKEWYHPYVDYAVEHGLFGGTSANTFEPETAMTRAMLVTVLWRYEGEPEAGENTFSDVPNGQWYTNAVAWAAENGIVGGVGNNRFDPDGEITREQMATILFRYAEKKEIDTSKRGSLNIFSDEKQLSAYAKDAVQWAVAEQIINGSDGKLLPQGSATRAQVATILMRFIENIVKK